MNKENIYKITSMLSNIIIVIATIFLVFYAIAPLLGGKFLVDAIVKYGSWIGIALAIKIVLKRAEKGVRIGAYEFVLLFLIIFLNLVVWFPYPINLISGSLCIMGLILSYRQT